MSHNLFLLFGASLVPNGDEPLSLVCLLSQEDEDSIFAFVSSSFIFH